jgi:carbamoyltransferase
LERCAIWRNAETEKVFQMKILGISGGFRQGYQDVTSCLVVNGEVIAAVEEERLNRIKFSAGRLPYLSVIEVLKIGGLKFEDIDAIAFHGSTWEEVVQTQLEQYFIQHFGSCPKFYRFHHHDCHASSTFYASGFKEATVITLDNSGDGISLQIMKGENSNLELVDRFERPNSLGLFYQVITQYCGFIKDSDEYKLMGLSSYGDRTAFDFSWLIDFNNGKLEINTEYIVVPTAGAPSLHKDEMAYTKAFEEKMGTSRRIPKSEITTFYKNVAASAQAHFEVVLLKIVKYYSKSIGYGNVCLAGGAALNCVANQIVMNAKFIDKLFIQPAAGDAGIAMGAAWLCSLKLGYKPKPTENTYLGSNYNNYEIEQILKTSQLSYQLIEDAAIDAAKEIATNKVIGWFQDSMEFGPRALGNRSILANACNPDMQEIVNSKIKFRESFRPFCPSVLEEDAPLYFDGKQMISPYMTITYLVKPESRNLIPSVWHIDGTARIQTVNRNQNAKFYDLLFELKKQIGHGVVLNTSFNLSHEPIVCNPRDAIATFFASGMDILYLGDFKIKK